MHLVINHMTEFDHIDDTDSSELVEPVSCSTISEVSAAISRKSGLICVSTDFIKACTVENRCTELDSKSLACPSEDGLVNLTEVHS